MKKIKTLLWILLAIFSFGNFNSAFAITDTVVVYVVPATPTGLTATPGACATARIDVLWNAVPGATGYTLMINGSTTVNLTTNSYAHTGLTANTSYSYKVLAYNTVGSSAYSSVVSVTSPASSCLPSTPTNLTATASTCGTGVINLTWTAPVPATMTGYVIKDGTTVIATLGLVTSYSHTGLVAGSSHSYTIAATNAGGTSAYSVAVARTAPSLCVVTGTAGTGGTISPASQTANAGTTKTLTVTPNSGYAISSVSGCSGSLSGKTYTTGAINANCTVTASFVAVGVTVTANPLNYYISPGATTAVTFSSTTTSGSTECRMLDSASNPLTTTFTATTSINVTIPASTGDYGYYVQCRSTADTSITAKSALVHIYGVTVGVSATSSYSVSPGASVSFAYTPTTQYGSTECALLNNVDTALTTYQAASPIVYTIPNSIGSFGYYVKCRHASNTNLTAKSALITVTTSCPVGQSWNSTTSTCVGPSGTISTTNCEINAESNTCNTTINWSVSNPIGSSAVTTPTNITVSTLNSGSTTYSVYYGSRTFYLYNNSNELGSSVATASCKSGTAWDTASSKCKSATGTLSATGCEIQSTKSSCMTNLVWNTINPSSVSVLKNDTTNTTITTANSGNTNYSIGPGVVDFKLWHNGVVIASAQAVASCASMTVWNGSSCVLKEPEIDVFKAEPSTVFKGRSSTISWSSNAALVNSCTGNGFSTGGNITGSVVVTPSVKTTYSLTCSRDAYSTTKSITVKVIDMSIKEQ